MTRTLLSSFVWAACAAAAAAPVRAQEATAAAAIMKADAAFSQAVADRSRERFLSFIAETAVFNGGRPDEARGHDAILKAWSPFFEPGGPTLTWIPEKAEVLVGGDVGYSIGRWTRRARTPDGRTTEARGQYLTTWQRQSDGSWKVVFDTGSTQPAVR